MLWLIITIAHAACPATPAELQATLNTAQSALEHLDQEAFLANTTLALAEASCLSAPTTPLQSAFLHRMIGIRAFVDGREAEAIQAFAAAYQLDPSYNFPESLLPAGHPIRALYANAASLSPSLSPVPPPVSGQLAFDGTISLLRPSSQPTLSQWVQSTGAVNSAYLWPNDPMLSYPIATEAPTPTKQRAKISIPLAIGTALSTVAAGSCYALAYQSHEQFYDSETPLGELSGLRDRSNGLFFTSVGTGALALGLGVSTVITWNH